MKFSYMRSLLNNKVWTLFTNTVNFFFANGERKPLFQAFEVGWLSPKLAAILARPKQPCDVTGCITLLPRWKLTVIMGEETSVLSQKNPIFRTSQNCKVVSNSSLTHEEEETRSCGFFLFSWTFPGYFIYASKRVGCIIVKWPRHLVNWPVLMLVDVVAN